jgi:hypothetical protein
VLAQFEKIAKQTKDADFSDISYKINWREPGHIVLKRG